MYINRNNYLVATNCYQEYSYQNFENFNFIVELNSKDIRGNSKALIVLMVT